MIKYFFDKNDYRTTTQEGITIHRQLVHPNEKYKCNECANKSHSKTILKGHVQSVHEAINNNCDKCNYNTTTKENLNEHIQNAHQNAEGPKTFSNRS